ncbi:hypothetical protein VN97_g2028 [Penicillium thymicola]|uniref:Uncharacterized protein n=1 Tax=Penicillium thymicola TaxID=293382 RepID=A0AAI9XBU7_PENTH|nr:hypothetical protein VN97_g2028 [Penicillium thymicola]
MHGIEWTFLISLYLLLTRSSNNKSRDYWKLAVDFDSWPTHGSGNISPSLSFPNYFLLLLRSTPCITTPFMLYSLKHQ